VTSPSLPPVPRERGVTKVERRITSPGDFLET